MDSIEKQIIKDFKKNRKLYEELDAAIGLELKRIVSENKFFVMEITHRVKTLKSLTGKLEKKQGKYNSIYDITDLCGARLICYFSDTVDEIADALRDRFLVDEENSIDKRANLSATQFGYLSLHYVCSLRPSREYSDDLCQIKFEIQIRTVLQHAWAEIEHDLGYKSEFAIPRPLRREFSRIAGLLEVADSHFVGLRGKISDYENEIREQIAQGKAGDLTLDQVTLREFIKTNHNMLKFIERLKRDIGVEYIESNTEKYLRELDWLGVNTLGELSVFIDNNQDLAYELIRYKLGELEHDIVTSSMLLRYTLRAELIRGNYSHDQIVRFMQLGTSNPELVKSRTQILENSIKIIRQLDK